MPVTVTVQTVRLHLYVMNPHPFLRIRKIDLCSLRSVLTVEFYLACYIPSADAFQKGIYMIEIGGNDFSYAYKNLKLSPSQLSKSVLPNIARSIAAAVQVLSF
jgi:hypothetical protein